MRFFTGPLVLLRMPDVQASGDDSAQAGEPCVSARYPPRAADIRDALSSVGRSSGRTRRRALARGESPLRPAGYGGGGPSG